MQQLTTKEQEIYKNYIFKQIAEKFKDFGTINIEYLKIVTDFKYEISDVTNLIYPTIEFRKSFEKLKTLSKIEINNKPNNLFDDYEIKTIQIPTCYILGKKDNLFTPYQKNNKSAEEITDYLNDLNPLAFHIKFNKEDFTVLTNGEKNEFDFITFIDNKFIKMTYILPINYEKNKSLELYEHYRNIKEQIRNIVNNIKPIDNEKLYELVINHYKNS